MNITCHSSFDTNLRIRVSTSTGQKDVGTKTKTTRVSKPKPTHQPTIAVSPAFIEYESVSKSYTPNFESQIGSFQPAPLNPMFTQEPQGIPLPGPVSNVTALQYPNGWAYDFSLEPGIEQGFQQSHDVSMSTSIFGPPTPRTYPAANRQSYPISDSEGSNSSKSQTQHSDGTREWVPRRRKRPKNMPSPQTYTTTTEERKASDCTHILESAALPRGGPWTLESFALDFVQKRAPHCAMRQAVMAWSAREFATGLTATDTNEGTWYIQASGQVDKLMTLENPTVQLGDLQPVTNGAEIIICSAFFLNRYDVSGGDVNAADSRLERMARWLAGHPGDLNLSGFTSKLLLYSCYLQIRLSMFGGAFPRFSFLLDVLLARPDHHQIVHKSSSFYWDMFGNNLPRELVIENLEKIQIYLRLHELFCLLAAMLHYRSAQRSQAVSQDPASWEEHVVARYSGIESSLRRAEAEFDLTGAINPSAGVLRRSPMGGLAILASRGSSSAPSDLGDTASPASSVSASPTVGELDHVSALWLTAYASLLTAKIMWSRMTQPAIRTDNASAAAAETILQIAFLLRRSRGYNLLHPSSLMLWPLPLFVAGIETLDEVRSDWVRMFLSEIHVGGMKPGSSNELLSLMEEVRRRQDQTGTRVYVDETMAETGRLRWIFAF